MSEFNRRQFLKRTLTALASAAGSVTLASTAVASGRSREKTTGEGESSPDNLQQRADELASAREPVAEGAPVAEAAPPTQFRNGTWTNGTWYNGGWRNYPWHNGPWGNGGWSNIPWYNGGFSNGGWRNWW